MFKEKCFQFSLENVDIRWVLNSMGNSGL